MISVIIPTFNESDNIDTLISYLRDCEKGEKIEIIIADSPKSSDETYEIAKKAKSIALKCQNASRAYQMNEGALMAQNDILYFLHADARPPRNFVDEILTKVENGCGFGIFAYRFDAPGFLLKCNAYFTRFDGIFAGGGDQSLFITKQLFEEIQGFDEQKLIMEDFDIYRRAKKSGANYCIVKNPLLVSARKYRNNSWLKVNLTNFRIFFIYLINGTQETMIRISKKLAP